MKNSLADLIKKYGKPDALIDHWSQDEGYAIWGYIDTLEWNLMGIKTNGICQLF